MAKDKFDQAVEKMIKTTQRLDAIEARAAQGDKDAIKALKKLAERTAKKFGR